MAKSKFFNKMMDATIERQVEDVYNEGISFYFNEEDGSPLKIKYPYSCDGLIETKTEHGKMLKLLMEFKFNYDFSNKVARAKVITQALFYIKRFEIDGSKLPNVVLIGDKNECFVFHTNDIIKYLDKDLNWKIAASAAPDKNPDLVLEIANDDNLNPFIFVINEDFSFKSVVDKINELAENIQRYVRVTEHNISNIFDYFTSRVVKNPKKISPNDIVAIFIGIITDSDNYYLHPKKSNIILTPFGDIQIDASQYQGFIKYFNRSYTPQEKMKFAEISDRLIEDTNRRNKGEFYTPTLFVDYAHSMISEQLGEDWKDEYVVWDNCCGTKNLTRDYRFKELYCSTLENAELDISKKYNPEATSFQFDFLNDELDKLPKGLLEAFEQNKKIVFFLNPPYATVANATTSNRKNKNVSIKTKTQETMGVIGKASANLYAQFLWRIKNIKEKYNLTNCYISLFCRTNFMANIGYDKFRIHFLNNFKFINGCVFSAGHFGETSEKWGISFNIWSSEASTEKNVFKHIIIDNINGDIKELGIKNIYNIDGLKPANEWAKDPIKKMPTEFFIPLKSGLNIGVTNGTKIVKNAFGSSLFAANNIYQSAQFVALFTGTINTVTMPTISICKENFDRIITLFSTRRNIPLSWDNWQDEYMVPNTNHPKYNNYVNDCLIFSLFDSKSDQTSLRQIKYHDKLWDIKNEFFWMSKDEIESLANEFNNDDCYSDAHTSPDRFVYKKLQEIELTPEAQAVLDKASEIVRKTFKYRPLFNDEHPEYQINNWDCGWYQIKALAKEFAKDDLEEFKQLYKALADKMRPMVYELGFLK